MVHLIHARPGQSFRDYALQCFIPYVLSFDTSQVDMLWDVFKEDCSIQQDAQKNTCGKGMDIKGADIHIPNRWNEAKFGKLLNVNLEGISSQASVPKKLYYHKSHNFL